MKFSNAKLSKLSVFIIPLVVYISIFFFAQCIAYAGNCHGWWGVCWSRFDSGLYVEISQIGHTLKHCSIENGYMIPSEKWCGNAGWAPFYPLLINVLNRVSGISASICGILISHGFFIGFLLISAFIINIKSYKISNWLTLFICGLCPGGFYYFSIYPISMVVFLLTFIFWSINIKKYQRCIIPAFLTTVTYSSSILILFCFGLFMVFDFFKSWKPISLSGLLNQLKTQWLNEHSYKPILLYVMIPGTAGLFSLFLYDWLVTGHWNAMFLVQSKFGHLIYSPFKHLEIHLVNLMNHLNSPLIWIDIQNIFFFFSLPILILLVVKLKEKLTPLLVIFLLIMWYIPFCIGIKVSLYRSIALLSPAFPFLHGSKNYQKIIVILVFGVLYYHLGKLFILSLLY